MNLLFGLVWLGAILIGAFGIVTIRGTRAMRKAQRATTRGPATSSPTLPHEAIRTMLAVDGVVRVYVGMRTRAPWVLYVVRQSSIKGDDVLWLERAVRAATPVGYVSRVLVPWRVPAEVPKQCVSSPTGVADEEES